MNIAQKEAVEYLKKQIIDRHIWKGFELSKFEVTSKEIGRFTHVEVKSDIRLIGSEFTSKTLQTFIGERGGYKSMPKGSISFQFGIKAALKNYYS